MKTSRGPSEWKTRRPPPFNGIPLALSSVGTLSATTTTVGFFMAQAQARGKTFARLIIVLLLLLHITHLSLSLTWWSIRRLLLLFSSIHIGRR